MQSRRRCCDCPSALVEVYGIGSWAQKGSRCCINFFLIKNLNSVNKDIIEHRDRRARKVYKVRSTGQVKCRDSFPEASFAPWALATRAATCYHCPLDSGRVWLVGESWDEQKFLAGIIEEDLSA